MLGLFDARARQDEAEIERIHRLGLAARDIRNFWLLYNTLQVLVVRTTDPQARNRISMALGMVENWTPTTANTETDTFENVNFYPTSQEI